MFKKILNIVIFALYIVHLNDCVTMDFTTADSVTLTA